MWVKMYVVLPLPLASVLALMIVLEQELMLSLAALPATRSLRQTARAAVSVAVADVSGHVVARWLVQPFALPWAFVLPSSVDVDG